MNKSAANIAIESTGHWMKPMHTTGSFPPPQRFKLTYTLSQKSDRLRPERDIGMHCHPSVLVEPREGDSTLMPAALSVQGRCRT